MNHTFDILVIGGGPAGMMAAGRAGHLGARVLLVEKNNRLGKKLSITGGRRCNITNAEPDNRLFLENFPESKQFLFSPFSQFNVEDTFTFFESRGLPLVVEAQKRTFPKSQKAEDVCRVLSDYVYVSGNVTVQLNAAVRSLIVTDGILQGLETSKGAFYGKRLIFATGGLAAPETGSTGEGLSMLGSIGHTIKQPDPNLAPLRTTAKWVHALSGISVDNITLRFVQNGKTQHKAHGRLLFTHFGISGPMVINSAHTVRKLLTGGALTASIDLFPDLDLKQLDTHLQELFGQQKNKQLKTALKDMLQKKLSDAILHILEPSIGEIAVHSVTKEQRKGLVHLLKNLSFPITGTMGFAWSIVADGGVTPKEVDFKSMTSKLYPNLYLVGDTIDINRPSGGFSLQLCWTTGFIAGTHAAQSPA
ncbi:TPA: aminoacetone oxidase family FAD-binding enzyme [Candidatus Uhrbacteria bacterium]|nr:aminoacetone oxidase family FAD-binding enzyme [Candidatus Uhrbacteria bacterium]